MGGKLWHRVPDETGKAQLEEVNFDTLKIERPTVIYLSGFLTCNNRPGFIAGGIKKVEELLDNADLQDTKPDIYAWSHKGLSNLFNLAAYDTFPNRFSSKAGYTLAENVLMPMVTKDFKRHEDGSCEGEKLPAEQAARNLRNLTLFGYSAGSIVAQETFNATMKLMQSVGYEEDEARKLLKEIVLTTVGCISRPTKETDRFTTVTLVASNDRINRFKNFAWGTIGTVRRMFTTGYLKDKHTKALNIRPFSSSYAFLTAAVRPSLHEYKYDDSGLQIKKYFTPLYPKWTGRRSFHEIPHYVTTDPNNNQFSNVALHTLTNAINRSETEQTPKPLDLVMAQTQNPIMTEDQVAYNARIMEAIQPTPTALIARLDKM